MADPTKIKICGLTDPDEAAGCAEAGAWAIGLVFFAGSPRFVTPEQGARVAAALPPDVARVGVFVDPEPGELTRAVEACGLTHVQLHGSAVTVVEARRASGCAVIAGVPASGPDALARAASSDADLVIVDASVAGRHGGTGQVFDWTLLVDHPLERTFILAGGLTERNVGAAIARVRPWAVDVSSGVEHAPGRKDVGMVERFIAAVHAADRVGSAA